MHCISTVCGNITLGLTPSCPCRGRVGTKRRLIYVILVQSICGVASYVLGEDRTCEDLPAIHSSTVTQMTAPSENSPLGPFSARRACRGTPHTVVSCTHKHTYGAACFQMNPNLLSHLAASQQLKPQERSPGWRSLRTLHGSIVTGQQCKRTKEEYCVNRSHTMLRRTYLASLSQTLVGRVPGISRLSSCSTLPPPPR